MGISLVDAELPGNVADIEKQLFEAVNESQQSDDTKQQQQSRTPEQRADAIEDGEDVPAKLRGKSRAEIIEYYRNLESAYGRQANDLGTQRALTDRILNLKRESDLSSNTPPSRVEIKTQDLLDNPTEAIERAVSARLKAKEEEDRQRMAEHEAAIARDRFLSKHSDYENVANDPEFVQWLQKSPYRVRTAQQARNGDWTAADDLLSEFKERKQATKTVTNTENTVDKNVEAARGAALESGTSSESASKKGGKIYRRVDLMRLRTEKPDVYYDDTFQAEILKAYAEKRVR
jgi:hypothetical protein